MANTIDPSLLLSNYQKKESKTGTNILGKDDFLKILMTQLQNQDPLNPMEDKDFVAQMASFSTLEQITNMGKSFSEFVQTEKQTNLFTYSELLGKNVTWEKQTESDSKLTGNGKVVSVQLSNNEVQYFLEDGTQLQQENILQIDNRAKENSLIQASVLIGKTVSYLTENNEEKTAIIKSVSSKNGEIQFQLNDELETKINASRITRLE
ncbi:flagellar hook assembly protein FlgD [Bacillus sp. 03113]|uniref:flagellar hook assembly protein FlgD n=1 Tax=Bacillus sp. 03113 TaxID=2578211 RepID=UPI001143B882|nr:flagellar hook assembly protein FlgD [Bacillus sp. 03113]